MNLKTMQPIVQKPRRVRHSYTQSIHATPDEVFPLLCPVREMDWAPGWQPDWVISDSGVAEQGCVFQTPEDAKERTAPATWVVTQYHPETYQVEMLKIIPQHTVMKLEASLRDDPQGGTQANISYEYTALGPQGERFMDGCTEDWYRQFMLGWEKAMNDYLATGKKVA